MAFLMINGKWFEYDEIHLSYATVSAVDHDTAKELLLKTKEIFDRNGLPFCLMSGTLLGAVRDKGFIEGDEDIDTIICEKDEQKLLETIPELYDNNIKLCRIEKVRKEKPMLYSFMYKNGCYIDVYVIRPIRFSIFGLYCYKAGISYQPKKFYKETQEIEFLGATFRCPKDPEKLLEFMYGKTWRTPVRGHKFRYEVYPAYVYHRAIYAIKQVIKFCIGYKYWRKDRPA